MSVPPTSKSCLKYTHKIELVLKEISKSDIGNQVLNRLWIYASPKKPASLFPKSKNATPKNNKVMKFPIINKKVDNNNALLTPEIFEKMRKPETGMFDEFLKDFQENMDKKVHVIWKYYCGDAAGRPNDFSDSDKEFAKKIDVPFKLPEEVFL